MNEQLVEQLRQRVDVRASEWLESVELRESEAFKDEVAMLSQGMLDVFSGLRPVSDLRSLTLWRAWHEVTVVKGRPAARVWRVIVSADKVEDLAEVVVLYGRGGQMWAAVGLLVRDVERGWRFASWSQIEPWWSPVVFEGGAR